MQLHAVYRLCYLCELFDFGIYAIGIDRLQVLFSRADVPFWPPSRNNTFWAARGLDMTATGLAKKFVLIHSAASITANAAKKIAIEK